jgi:hypothetical protein
MLRNLFNTLYVQVFDRLWIRKTELITPEGIRFNMEADSLGGASDRPQAQPAWEHEEMALLVVEYFYYKDSKAETEKSNRFISEILRRRGKKLGIVVGEKYRNYKGIESQRNNLSHFDPEYTGELTGHESKWMKEIVQEYIDNPESIQREAYELIKKYMIE